MKGYIHIYTGDGKGKTTAALGLAVRAAGAGLKVFIGQFIKMGEFSEIKALRRFSDLITIEQFGSGTFINAKPTIEDIEMAQKGLERIRDIFVSGKYTVVIMEEANVALDLNLISLKDLIDIIDEKPSDTELIITGRNAPDLLIEKADLVTEMKSIKHYYEQGQSARIGIEK